MKIKKIHYFRKYNKLNPYIKAYFTFDEAKYVLDYINNKEKDSATGVLRSKLEKILK